MGQNLTIGQRRELFDLDDGLYRHARTYHPETVQGADPRSAEQLATGGGGGGLGGGEIDAMR